MKTDVKTLYLTTAEDGTDLVLHLGTPRFCVGGESASVAHDKAVRALAYYDSVKGSLSKHRAKEVRVLTPVYEARELCA